ncbi:hypothetical protein [Acinetobacter terrae]|uniref:Transcriptional regulator n=1 Tax=Acinetobacter terrae TaxID=2731247 RepID=A0A4R0ER97_9GAMM|nr:hypothetical protein [Acinetobacter terrae]TCB62228.1 hypothetical protein E0H85_01520 [Acinetobacter terrae]
MKYQSVKLTPCESHNDIESRSQTAFEKRMDMLVFAAYATQEFTVKDIQNCVVDCQIMTIRRCLKDLIYCGYLIKTSIYTFKATEKTKQLFGVTTA